MKPGQMRPVIKCLFILVVGFSVSIFPVYSQVTESNTDQQSSIPDEINYREKIFLHTDRKLYLSGEIIWFKGYCTYRNLNVLSDVSKVMYVEVLNNQNNPVLSEKILLDRGTGYGSIYIPRSIQTGIYYIRAYTRWMTNFSPEYFFIDKLYIVNPFLPLETNIIPDESEDYTINFYTEHGRLRKGQRSEIAFHAATKEGCGVNLKGWAVNESGDTLTELNAWKYGYGLFSFIPEINGQYKVTTISSNGKRKEIILPFPVINETPLKESDEYETTAGIKELNLMLNSDKSTYTPREKVTLTIETKNPEGQAVISNMSISVYKSENQIGFNHKNIFQYLNYNSFFPDYMSFPDDQFPFSEYNSDTLKKILNIIYSSADNIDTDLDVSSDYTYILPETRGLTLTGTVYSALNGSPSSGIKVYVAQPGKTAQIYTTRSGGSGRFQVRLLNQYGRNDIIVMPAENPDNYYIILDEDFNNSYSTINKELFRPDDRTIGYIERLMINLQVEDAFGNSQVQESDLNKYNLPDIYGNPDESVLLEDYIKLPAVEELFIELVKSVLIKRKRNNNFELQIIDPLTKAPIMGKPLFLMDGVPVLDINPVIIYMDPVDIEKIDVVTTHFIQGNEVYNGIINIVTKQADFHHFDLPVYAIRKPYEFFQVPGTFHSPDYSSDSDSLRSIPDFRNLLYWNPEIVTDNKGTATVSFFTADDISDYRIVIQGLSEDGLPGYSEAVISVR
jgi:hypothetical protein